VQPNRRKGGGRNHLHGRVAGRWVGRHRHGCVASRGRDDARSAVGADEGMDPLWGEGCTYFDGKLTTIFHRFQSQKTPLNWGCPAVARRHP